jgi:hypothetical protein
LLLLCAEAETGFANAALGADTSKRGVAAFLSSNDGADYRALKALTWFYNWGDNVRAQGFDLLYMQG